MLKNTEKKYKPKSNKRSFELVCNKYCQTNIVSCECVIMKEIEENKRKVTLEIEVIEETSAKKQVATVTGQKGRKDRKKKGRESAQEFVAMTEESFVQVRERERRNF